jgi:hypothetical protein
MADEVTTIDGVFGKRYGEVLLVTPTESSPEATVYNTFPLNDCPGGLWDKLDAKAIAEDNDAVAVLLNGPRYWLMSSIGKVDRPRRTLVAACGVDIRAAQTDVSAAGRHHRPGRIRHPGRPGQQLFIAS